MSNIDSHNVILNFTEPLDKSQIKIGSISTLLNILNDFEIDNDHVLFYRGHSKDSYELKPSIYRNEKIISNEHIMFKELLLRCPSDFSHCKNTFEFLVKMQHYSLPTRLLDITTNPLIALFFTASSNSDYDGEVIVLKIPKKDIKYYDSDTVSVISNISKRPLTINLKNRLNKDDFNRSQETGYLLHEIRAEKPYFFPIIDPEHLESVVCVKPKLDNPRIIRQDGAFLLFGFQTEKKNCALFPEKYLGTTNKNRIIIKGSMKKKLLKQLATLGITQATIYPEIEKVASYISQIYAE